MNLVLTGTCLLAVAVTLLTPTDALIHHHGKNRRKEFSKGNVFDERGSVGDQNQLGKRQNSDVALDVRATKSNNAKTLKLAADDIIDKLYIDGNSYQVPHSSTLEPLASVRIPANSNVVAVESLNLQGKAGFLGFTTDGSLYSDITWKCTSSDQPISWMLPNFDDSTWPNAVVFHEPTKLKEKIPAGAKWIWTKNGDRHVYCRGRFRSFGCPSDFTYVDSLQGCYKVVLTNRDWNSAVVHCSTLNKKAHLVAIKDMWEQEAVANILRSYSDSALSNCRQYNKDFKHAFWTAGELIDPAASKTFAWKIPIPNSNDVIVSSMSYTNWQPGQPNGGTGSPCVSMYRGKEYRWADDPRGWKSCSVCEIDLQ